MVLMRMLVMIVLPAEEDVAATPGTAPSEYADTIPADVDVDLNR